MRKFGILAQAYIFNGNGNNKNMFKYINTIQSILQTSIAAIFKIFITNTHTIYMNSLSSLLIALGMNLLSDLLGPANLRSQKPPPPPQINWWSV